MCTWLFIAIYYYLPPYSTFSRLRNFIVLLRGPNSFYYRDFTFVLPIHYPLHEFVFRLLYHALQLFSTASSASFPFTFQSTLFHYAVNAGSNLLLTLSTDVHMENDKLKTDKDTWLQRSVTRIISCIWSTSFTIVWNARKWQQQHNLLHLIPWTKYLALCPIAEVRIIQTYHSSPLQERQKKKKHGASPLRMDYGGQKALHNNDNRTASHGNNGNGQSMPPPTNRHLGLGIGHNHFPTPSQHRNLFGTLPQAHNIGGYINPGRINTGRSTPSSQRQTLARVGANNADQPHVSGLLMSAGRQQQGKLFILFVPLDPKNTMLHV